MTHLELAWDVLAVLIFLLLALALKDKLKKRERRH